MRIGPAWVLPLLAPLALLAFANCASTASLPAPLRQREIRIDGQGEDWEGGLTAIESLGLSLGARYDDEALYLAIATAKPALQMAILQRGLVVWLDPAGGKERRLGLRYPAALGEPGPEGPPPGSERPAAGADFERVQRERLERRLATLPAECLILRGADDSGRLSAIAEVPGLAVSLRLEGTRLLCELRLPFATSERGLLPLARGDETLGLGLALGERPSFGGGERPSRGGMGGGPGGMGGMGGGPGGGPGGMGGGPGGMGGGPGGRGQAEATLDGWVELQLTP